MTDSPEPETDAPKSRGITVTDPRNAPIVYFEGASNYGVANGGVNVTLAFNRHLAKPSEIAVDAIGAAHLRCSIPAAMDLIEALKGALLLAQKPSGGSH